MLAACTRDDPPAERFRVVLTHFGDSLIEAIKMVRDVTGLGLADAKALVDNVPSVIKDNLSAEEAESLAEKFRLAGMKVEVHPHG